MSRSGTALKQVFNRHFFGLGSFEVVLLKRHRQLFEVRDDWSENTKIIVKPF